MASGKGDSPVAVCDFPDGEAEALEETIRRKETVLVPVAELETPRFGVEISTLSATLLYRKTALQAGHTVNGVQFHSIPVMVAQPSRNIHVLAFSSSESACHALGVLLPPTLGGHDSQTVMVFLRGFDWPKLPKIVFPSRALAEHACRQGTQWQLCAVVLQDNSFRKQALEFFAEQVVKLAESFERRYESRSGASVTFGIDPWGKMARKGVRTVGGGDAIKEAGGPREARGGGGQKRKGAGGGSAAEESPEGLLAKVSQTWEELWNKGPTVETKERDMSPVLIVEVHSESGRLPLPTFGAIKLESELMLTVYVLEGGPRGARQYAARFTSLGRGILEGPAGPTAGLRAWKDSVSPNSIRCGWLLKGGYHRVVGGIGGLLETLLARRSTAGSSSQGGGPVALQSLTFADLGAGNREGDLVAMLQPLQQEAGPFLEEGEIITGEISQMKHEEVQSSGASTSLSQSVTAGLRGFGLPTPVGAVTINTPLEWTRKKDRSATTGQQASTSAEEEMIMSGGFQLLPQAEARMVGAEAVLQRLRDPQSKRWVHRHVGDALMALQPGVNAAGCFAASGITPSMQLGIRGRINFGPCSTSSKVMVAIESQFELVTEIASIGERKGFTPKVQQWWRQFRGKPPKNV
jgi:hypothetical protein